MEILNEIYDVIEEHRYSNSSKVMAKAVLSACSCGYDAPPLLAMSGFDDENKERIFRLINICEQGDFSNAAQDEMIGKVLKLYPELKD